MIYIDILPQIRNDIFCARIVMSEYDIPDQIAIRITARRNDGTYITKIVKYPEEGAVNNEEVIVSFFGMSKSLIAQIVSVCINGVEIRTNNSNVDGTDLVARYDDSITRMPWNESMNKIDLYFEVLNTNNPKTFIVTDQSEWGILADRPAIIEIERPGSEKIYTYYLGKNQINIFDSRTLGINPGKKDRVDIPDGVYNVKIIGSPSSYNFSRKYLKTDSLRINIDKVWSRAMVLCDHEDDDIIEKIKEVEYVLASAESNMRLGNMVMVKSLMEKAEKIVHVLNNCDGCGCKK